MSAVQRDARNERRRKMRRESNRWTEQVGRDGPPLAEVLDFFGLPHTTDGVSDLLHDTNTVLDESRWCADTEGAVDYYGALFDNRNINDDDRRYALALALKPKDPDLDLSERVEFMMNDGDVPSGKWFADNAYELRRVMGTEREMGETPLTLMDDWVRGSIIRDTALRGEPLDFLRAVELSKVVSGNYKTFENLDFEDRKDADLVFGLARMVPDRCFEMESSYDHDTDNPVDRLISSCNTRDDLQEASDTVHALADRGVPAMLACEVVSKSRADGDPLDADKFTEEWETAKHLPAALVTSLFGVPDDTITDDDMKAETVAS